MKFVFSPLHGLEDAQRNFEQIAISWMQLQDFAGAEALTVWGGTGPPSNSNGADGDVYIAKDGGAGTTVYQKRTGSWTAIL